MALYDYADAAERHLGVSAYVLFDRNAHNNFRGAVDKFAQRFGDRVVALDGWQGADPFLSTRSISVVYAIKCNNDDRVSRLPGVRTCIHCVFDAGAPYGDVYAKISPCVPGACPVVPHIVRRARADGPDMRAELGIPPSATVFGRYGGYESFDIDCAREALLAVARSPAANVYFLLMNTPPLSEGDEGGRIIYMERTSDEHAKSCFIRTCDAMLHARSSGETFGLSVGEFSAHNRPVITSRDHTDGGIASFHLDTLGSKGVYYSTKDELIGILTSFDRAAAKRADHNAYRTFEPAAVMATFDKVFLRGKSRKDVPDWKRWRHGSGGGGRGRGDSATSVRHAPPTPDDPSYPSYLAAKAEWERGWALQDALGKLRGLPAEPEAAISGHGRADYRVVSSLGAPVRLAPSTSAATVATLEPKARVVACAMRGPWVRLQEAEGRPRWVLTRHPEDGDQLEQL